MLGPLVNLKLILTGHNKLEVSRQEFKVMLNCYPDHGQLRVYVEQLWG